ncbi:MAG TPA: hypothetical protein VIG25_00935, partial [Pyrinomonadaceae bacterium]
MNPVNIRIFIVRIAFSIAMFVVPTISVRAQSPHPIDWNGYQDRAVKLMQQYLRVNTSNPPGN